MHDDELIDRAAQAMTRGAPSPRLRAAVRARIAPARVVGVQGLTSPVLTPQVRPTKAPSSARRLWIPALAGAGFAVLAAVVSRSIVTAPVEPLPSTRHPSASFIATPVTLQPGPVAVTRATTAGRVRGRGTTPRSIVVEPLVIDPISVPLIAVDSSAGVMPIQIEPLQIEPLQSQ